MCQRGIRARGHPSCLAMIAKTRNLSLLYNMTAQDSSKPSPRWALILFLILFIGTAAWGGYVLAKNAELRQSQPSSDPIKNQSLFGR